MSKIFLLRPFYALCLNTGSYLAPETVIYLTHQDQTMTLSKDLTHVSKKEGFIFII